MNLNKTAMFLILIKCFDGISNAIYEIAIQLNIQVQNIST